MARVLKKRGAHSILFCYSRRPALPPRRIKTAPNDENCFVKRNDGVFTRRGIPPHWSRFHVIKRQNTSPSAALL